ncbi:hypothetical protein RclHR1_00760031 [Rhizophagus clarus]|nr:hypothetical protein RclHR1_00760031 [Rhizophagus clarus]
MYLFIKFILFYEAFSFFIAFVLSCSPDITDWTPISISTSASPIRRLNIQGYDAHPGRNIIVWSGGDHPAFNEIFVLTQPINGIYEFRPFEDFTLAIESAGNKFRINTSGNTIIEKFYIECDICESKKNSTDWIQHYSLCSIMSIASGLCMSNDGGNEKQVHQVDCAIASKWVVWGRTSTSLTMYPDCPKCPVCPTCPTCPVCPKCPTCPMCPPTSNCSSFSYLAFLAIGFLLGMLLQAYNNHSANYRSIK